MKEHVFVVLNGEGPLQAFYFWGQPVQDPGGIGGFVREGKRLVWHQVPWASVRFVKDYAKVAVEANDD